MKDNFDSAYGLNLKSIPKFERLKTGDVHINDNDKSAVELRYSLQVSMTPWNLQSYLPAHKRKRVRSRNQAELSICSRL